MHAIRLRGARTHNLRGVDLDLSPGQLVAITGVSGSGKSSLALDTLYSEGQRRFVESFSPYARQFLERLERPPMDELAPVAAGVAVDRRAPVKSSRSTVATMADLEPYLSALFAREAVPVCPEHGEAAVRVDPTVLAERAAREHAGTTGVVTYPVRVPDAETFLDVREELLARGYRRLWIGGEARDLESVAPSEVGVAAPVESTASRTAARAGKGQNAGRSSAAERARVNGRAASLDVIVDRVRIGPDERRRIAAAIEEAFKRASGTAHLVVGSGEGAQKVPLAPGLTCPTCARSFEPPRPGIFSYQSPVGACPACRGFGRTIGVDWAKVIPDERRTIAGGAIRPWSGPSTKYERRLLFKFCEKNGIPLDKPWAELDREARARVIEGEGTWSGGRYPGVRAWFAWLESRTYKMHVRVLLARYRSYDECAACGGRRLSPEALRYRVDGLDLAEWHTLELREARARLCELRTTTGQGELARRELVDRLGWLERAGLGYLTLDRQARTLSGGEAQRIALTSALGTSLTGALFVLDEPTVGLHPTDIPPLIEAMRELARRDNVVLVIEHEPLVIAACDRVVELGPQAGSAGGRIVFDGSPLALATRDDLATGRAMARALSPARTVGAEVPSFEPGRAGAIRIVGAAAQNLRDVTVEIPLGAVVAVTGPSGSGKSTLVEEVLYRALARARGYQGIEAPGRHVRIEGAAGIASVTLVDQSPLGRTSRGNPATYTGAWNRIRALFAATDDAKSRGLVQSHFSFNVALGRCEACNGEGAETIEMQFLADVSVTCPSCRGRRFKEEVLAVRWEGRSVADVLEMSVEDALACFEREASITRALGPLRALGLGYLPLGQPLSTLSGGEAQRLKLARALAETPGKTLFLLDEPSAGLHAAEVEHMVGALRALVKAGASVVVVDHDLDVIRAADWVVDLGPGAGVDGGRVVATGPPHAIARTDTRTGRALRAVAHIEPRTAPAAEARDAAIEVFGAREHNLAELSTSIPHGKVVVVTGPSGSGKSTLAFDVVFAEGQRRFLETLTPYARQFLPTLPRPDVDRVTGVPPSIALEQRTTRSGVNSTVATVTEIAHYLRLLFAKVGEARCPSCDVPIEALSLDAIHARLTSRAARGTHRLLAPAIVARKGTHLDVFTSAARAGIESALADGIECSTDAPPRLDRRREHTIELVVFWGRLRDLEREDVERALSFGSGSVVLESPDGTRTLLSTSRTCPRCGAGVPEVDPRWFSFNTRQGRCEVCEGSGLAVEDETGDGSPCLACGGSRLAPIPRAVRLAGERYHEVNARSITDALRWAKALSFDSERARIAEASLGELLRRLAFVEEVGLGYLTLDRRAVTLSGGEMQRLRLAAQLGSGLTGALYVLDEPTIGLHPRDTSRLLSNLRALADAGSTVLLVEHDAETIRAADHLIDLGPGGGRHGGRVVAEGPPSRVLTSESSPTARALRKERDIARCREARPGSEGTIVLSGARAHNLKIRSVSFPAGRLTVVAGVSGSGKSTLVRHVLFRAARRLLGLEGPEPGPHDALRLPRDIARVVAVDQSPIGRTPRSVPATFLGIWDDVRTLFAGSPEARVRGYDRSRFSFNSASGGGRCQACEGQGVIVHEMSFLPDVTTPCEACGGMRFEPSTLDVRYLGMSIGEVLNLTAEEACSRFAAHPSICEPLRTMCDLGVGYLRIGQGSHTLSGGEAQRLKLASELSLGPRARRALYVLDEPTTGLHLADVERLIRMLDRLVARGDTLVVIEHHPAVIACADHVIELGPDAGARGGEIVAAGPPADVARATTPTGKVLRDLLGA